MTRFQLSLEPLDARTLPSAVFALPDAPPAAAQAAQHADDAGAPTVASAGKVTMQDFNFVMKVNKASPDLN